MTGRHRRRWVRAKVHRELLAVYWWHRYLAQSIAFPFRRPGMWWFCRRLDLHFRFGFPMPPVEGEHFIRA